jgi:hypothetical protein
VDRQLDDSRGNFTAGRLKVDEERQLNYAIFYLLFCG